MEVNESAMPSGQGHELEGGSEPRRQTHKIELEAYQMMQRDPLGSDTQTMAPPHSQLAATSDFKGRISHETSPNVLQEVSLEAVCLESRLQVRAQTESRRVKEYAALMANGTEFPPIAIFNDGKTLWLGDGKHRTLAARQNGDSTIRAQVQQGTERDAFLHGLQVNAAHGMALTQAEKRAAVDLMLQDPAWCTWSDRHIAQHCGVTHPFVSKRRRDLTGNDYQLPKVRKVRRGHQLIEMDTTHIGKRGQSTDEPEALMDTKATGENDQVVEPEASGEVQRPLEPEPIGPSASDPQSEHDADQGADTAPYDGRDFLTASPERAAQDKAHGGLLPEVPDHGGQAQPKEAPCPALAQVHTFQAPLPVLHGLLDRLESDVSDFRAQYACGGAIVEAVLGSLEGALPQARSMLRAHSRRRVRDGVTLDVAESSMPEQDETMAPDPYKAQSPPSS
jgi:hypothetical protein